jgi:hypothetical protein
MTVPDGSPQAASKRLPRDGGDQEKVDVDAGGK